MSPYYDLENSGPTGLDTAFHLITNNDSSCPHLPLPASYLGSVSGKSAPKTDRKPFALMAFDLNQRTSDSSEDTDDSSFLFLDANDREYCFKPTPEISHSSSFIPLPLIPPMSSMQFPQLVDFAFQSFNLSPEPISEHTVPVPSPTRTLPPILSQLPSLSQPLFPPTESLSEGRVIFQNPVLTHPNSPYVPWPSPQHDCIPHSPTASLHISTFSFYSRPCSRSGAQAPEPPEFSQPQIRRSPTALIKVSKSLRHLRRTVKKNVSHVARRIGSLKGSFIQPSKVQPHDDHDDPWVLPSPTIFLPRPRSTAVSIDSANTTSLATWLASRQQQSQELESSPKGLMTLEEYERAGSWLDLSHGSAGCGLPDCEMHSHPSSNPADDTADTSTNESSILRLLLDHNTSSVLSSRRQRSPLSICSTVDDPTSFRVSMTTLDSRERTGDIRRDASVVSQQAGPLNLDSTTL